MTDPRQLVMRLPGEVIVSFIQKFIPNFASNLRNKGRCMFIIFPSASAIVKKFASMYESKLEQSISKKEAPRIVYKDIRKIASKYGSMFPVLQGALNNANAGAIIIAADNKRKMESFTCTTVRI